MIEALTNTRLLRAFRLAFYPAFETAAAKRFQALTREVQDARNAGDLAGAEELYLRAIAESQASPDQSYLNLMRYGLAQVYQEQQKYREAELIFSEELEKAVTSSQIHAANMALARLYREEGKSAQAEEHYLAALAQIEKPEPSTDREMYFSTAMSVAKFYVEQHRYADAEPLFERALQIREANRPSDSSLPHYLHDLARVYEAREKYAAAEELYRRALRLCEEFTEPEDFAIVRALDELARFCRQRGRYAEAEEFARRSLALVEEKMGAATERARVPISVAIDQLAQIYECQERYGESEPLRRRSFEIKEAAWGERNGWLWVDSLAAYASALHKNGREEEAARVDERVEAIRAKFPPGSVRTSGRLTAMPMKRTFRRRLTTFMNALRH